MGLVGVVAGIPGFQVVDIERVNLGVDVGRVHRVVTCDGHTGEHAVFFRDRDCEVLPGCRRTGLLGGDGRVECTDCRADCIGHVGGVDRTVGGHVHRGNLAVDLGDLHLYVGAVVRCHLGVEALDGLGKVGGVDGVVRDGDRINLAVHFGDGDGHVRSAAGLGRVELVYLGFDLVGHVGGVYGIVGNRHPGNLAVNFSDGDGHVGPGTGFGCIQGVNLVVDILAVGRGAFGDSQVNCRTGYRILLVGRFVVRHLVGIDHAVPGIGKVAVCVQGSQVAGSRIGDLGRLGVVHGDQRVVYTFQAFRKSIDISDSRTSLCYGNNTVSFRYDSNELICILTVRTIQLSNCVIDRRLGRNRVVDGIRSLDVTGDNQSVASRYKHLVGIASNSTVVSDISMRMRKVSNLGFGNCDILECGGNLSVVLFQGSQRLTGTEPFNAIDIEVVDGIANSLFGSGLAVFGRHHAADRTGQGYHALGRLGVGVGNSAFGRGDYAVGILGNRGYELVVLGIPGRNRVGYGGLFRLEVAEVDIVAGQGSPVQGHGLHGGIRLVALGGGREPAVVDGHCVDDAVLAGGDRDGHLVPGTVMGTFKGFDGLVDSRARGRVQLVARGVVVRYDCTGVLQSVTAVNLIMVIDDGNLVLDMVSGF